MECRQCKKGKLFQKRVILTVDVKEGEEWKTIDVVLKNYSLKCSWCDAEFCDDDYIIDDQTA